MIREGGESRQYPVDRDRQRHRCKEGEEEMNVWDKDTKPTKPWEKDGLNLRLKREMETGRQLQSQLDLLVFYESPLQ